MVPGRTTAIVKKIYHEIGARRDGIPVEAMHEFLADGADLDVCSGKIFSFLENYQLIKYGEVEIVEKECLTATDDLFWERLDHGIALNRKKVRSFLEELGHEGVLSLPQLEDLPQGYLSKTLHTVTHLLDGFFGIDSHFFNLIEGSHWVSEGLREKIRAESGSYMILCVKAAI